MNFKVKKIVNKNQLNVNDKKSVKKVRNKKSKLEK